MNSYRMTSDAEPREEDLAKLIHEVAIEAEKKSTVAKKALNNRVFQDMQDALKREGCN